MPGANEPAGAGLLLRHLMREVLPPQAAERLTSGVLGPNVIVDGRVAGSWKRSLTKRGVEIDVSLLAPLDDAGERELAAASARYARFLGQPLNRTT